MLNANEKTVILLASMACIFGLAIVFLPADKANIYIAIPSAIAGTGAAYLGTKKNDSDN